MKINLVSVEDSIITLGFRKLVSFTKSIHSNSETYFIPLMRNRTFLRMIKGSFGDITKVDECQKETIRAIAEPLSKGDIVGFSSMSGYAEMTRAIIKEIRSINPKA